MPDYATDITIGSSGGVLAHVGNPTRIWVKPINAFQLIYGEAQLKLLGAESGPYYVTLTGNRVLTAEVSGAIGELAVDRIDVHILNDVGAVVEFLFEDAVVGSAGLVDGIGSEFLDDAFMSVDLELSYSDYVPPG